MSKDNFTTKDSGKRQSFDTGMVRDVQDGKPRYDLIPTEGLHRLADLYARGAEKYSQPFPVTLENWYDIINIGCKTKHSTTIKNQYVTQSTPTQGGTCVSNVTLKNTQKQKGLTVTLKKLHKLENNAEVVMTETLRNEILGTLKDNEKTTNGGENEIQKDIRVFIKSTVLNLVQNLQNHLENESAPYYHTGLVRQMRQDFWIYREECVRFVEESLTEFTSTLTTYTGLLKLEGYYVASVIKDLECWEMILVELNGHSTICNLPHMLSLENSSVFSVGDDNWKKGQPYSRAYASLFRHLIQWREGDRSEDHISAVAWNAFALMYYEERMPELNDLFGDENERV